jgi:hypothetical protein
MRDMSRLTDEEIQRLQAIATNSEFATPEKQVIRELAVTLLHTVFDLQTLERSVRDGR